MAFRELLVPGAWEITPALRSDTRGTFFEWFTDAEFTAMTGHRLDFRQANCSVSSAGVLRGLHFAPVGNSPGMRGIDADFDRPAEDRDATARKALALSHGLPIVAVPTTYAGSEIVGVLPAGIHIGQELLPLGSEAVDELRVVRDLLPLATEVLGRWQIRVPHRHRRTNARLDAAAEQTRDRRTVRAVDLELDQFSAVDTNGPG